MKKIFVFLISIIMSFGITLSIGNTVSSQLNNTEINQYVKSIDSLRQMNALDRYFYPNRSFCGGSLYGFYDKGKLVYIESSDNVAAYEYRRNIYIRDTTVYKITANETLDPGDNVHVYRNVDTNFVFMLSFAPQMTISAGRKLIFKGAADPARVAEQLACVRQMRRELETEKIPRKELRK